MGKLNTYELKGTLSSAFQMLGIIPGAGSTFETVRVSNAALVAFIQANSAAADGREIEMQKSATHVQWRYVGDASWTNLVALTEITGPAGANGEDGEEVQLRKNSTHVQWKLASAVTWTDLIPLADLKGEAGTGLTNRGVWAAGTFNPGDYVFSTGSVGSTNSMWVLSDSAAYVSSVQPKDDPTHWIEQATPAGPPGEDGASVELQKTATHVQWRQVGGSWANLIALAEITGPTGNTGANGKTVLTTSGAPSAGVGTDGDFAYDPAAMIMYGPKTAGAWGSGTILKGTAGSAGAAGSKWHTGADAPTAGLGADGDYYLRTNGDYYGPKTAGSWGSVVASLKGADGAGGSGGVDLTSNQNIGGEKTFTGVVSTGKLILPNSVIPASQAGGTYTIDAGVQSAYVRTTGGGALTIKLPDYATPGIELAVFVDGAASSITWTAGAIGFGTINVKGGPTRSDGTVGTLWRLVLDGATNTYYWMCVAIAGGESGSSSPYAALSLGFGWIWNSAADAADYHQPSYARRGNLLHLRGKATFAGSFSTMPYTVGTLPVGFRPAKRKVFCAFVDSSSPLRFGSATVFVQTTGAIQIIAVSDEMSLPATDFHLLLDDIPPIDLT